jgi:hypothetical protein
MKIEPNTARERWGEADGLADARAGVRRRRGICSSQNSLPMCFNRTLSKQVYLRQSRRIYTFVNEDWSMRADAQACKGCMTKLAIPASAVHGSAAERRSCVPSRRGATRLGQISGVAGYDARSRPTRARRRASHFCLTKRLIPGLSIDKYGV